MRPRVLSGAEVVSKLELWPAVSVLHGPVGLWVIEQPEVAQYGMNGVGVVHPGDDTEPSLALSSIRVLVATDIAARGIDVDEVSHVIQVDLPEVPEQYVHRIGRTARAGAEGVAWAFCDPNERTLLRDIEKTIQMKVDVVDGHPFPAVTEPEPPKAKSGGGRRSRGGQRRGGSRPSASGGGSRGASRSGGGGRSGGRR